MDGVHVWKLMDTDVNLLKFTCQFTGTDSKLTEPHGDGLQK